MVWFLNLHSLFFESFHFHNAVGLPNFSIIYAFFRTFDNFDMGHCRFHRLHPESVIGKNPGEYQYFEKRGGSSVVSLEYKSKRGSPV